MSDAVQKLRHWFHSARPMPVGTFPLSLDGAREILAALDAAKASGAAERQAQIVAWLRTDYAQLIANTHSACMTELADTVEQGAVK